VAQVCGGGYQGRDQRGDATVKEVSPANIPPSRKIFSRVSVMRLDELNRKVVESNQDHLCIPRGRTIIGNIHTTFLKQNNQAKY
jgi:hypothetical protein